MYSYSHISIYIYSFKLHFWSTLSIETRYLFYAEECEIYLSNSLTYIISSKKIFTWSEWYCMLEAIDRIDKMDAFNKLMAESAKSVKHSSAWWDIVLNIWPHPLKVCKSRPRKNISHQTSWISLFHLPSFHSKFFFSSHQQIVILNCQDVKMEKKSITLYIFHSGLYRFMMHSYRSSNT